MNKNIFIGGAWPYANNDLHIGHLAALLPGDIIARYYRNNGDNVIYVSGTDCHGTPITIRAKKENVKPSEIAEKYHQRFADNFSQLGFSYDLYSSTMSDFHKNYVYDCLKKIRDNGYIYEKTELQDYCEKCNSFLSDREIVGTCPHCGKEAKGDQCEKCLTTLNAKEVLNKKCITCNSPTTEKPNTHLYFALSKFQDIITNLVKKKENVWRFNAVKETQKFLQLGLIDRAVTRQLDWGIDVPFKGFEDKKVYVWVEAVLGYLSAGSFVAKNKNVDFDAFMKDNDLVSYYVHGKDNIPFHTVIYPALLMAMNDGFKLPDYIISSEYVNMNNEKMSKSKGNLITINELIEKFPVDSIRYYMIANGPENKDINFSINDFISIHNKYLVGVFGNFINRNLSFINKKFEGKIPHGKIDDEIKNLTASTYKKAGSLIEQGRLKAAIECVMDYASYGNKFYDQHQPWVQVYNDIEDFNNTTYTCVYMIANLSNFFAPFMPVTCSKIKAKLNLPQVFDWKEITLSDDNLTIRNDDLLFERLK